MEIRGFECLRIHIDGKLHYGLEGRSLHGYVSVMMHNEQGVPVSQHRIPQSVVLTPGTHSFRTGGHEYRVEVPENRAGFAYRGVK